jgi:hypothetical protein
VSIWYIFPALVPRTKKNLATLFEPTIVARDLQASRFGSVQNQLKELAARIVKVEKVERVRGLQKNNRNANEMIAATKNQNANEMIAATKNQNANEMIAATKEIKCQ